MDCETILYAQAEGGATITLNRPDRMNALTGPVRRALLHALERGAEEARAVVLTGAGRGFCAGQDLGDAASVAGLDP